MIGGQVGMVFAALSFTGALQAAIALYKAAQGPELGRKSWRRIGVASWMMHLISVLGIIATLFYLIYTHDYRFHYVWSHSSNELPVEYMISCFWEGQEGSFLLWTFWHAILGTIVLFTAKKWSEIVVSIIAAVNLILASMILGVYVPEWLAKVFFSLALLVPAGYLALRFYRKEDSLGSKGILPLGGVVLALISLLIVWTDKAGFAKDGLKQVLSEGAIGHKAAFLFAILAIGTVVGFVIRHFARTDKQSGDRKEILSLFVLTTLGLVAMMAEFGTWKIGSSPFLSLKDAFPDAPIFQNDANFMPANGKGLNSLLQNYWMVIHPPTLFLGFASTAVPFAFVIAGVMKGKYTEWIRPASVWMIFSVAILGVGIIMGGYWAYETLNFGGYWNWDPVENSSFVPWIFGIAALHGVIAYRKSKAFLGFSMVLIVSVFLMVLYSTFLTRSGILGETSVHTFTDLGLSGQLLVLLLAFVFDISALFTARNKEIPRSVKVIPFKSAEFMLFLGVLALLFAGVVITNFTSVPVLNKILGTKWAPPAHTGFFYYRWTVFFAIGVAILSGIGQFMFWRKIRKASKWNSLLRPYTLAIGVAIVILFGIALFTDWTFSLDDQLTEWKAQADAETSSLAAGMRYIGWAIFVFADEILLFASVFMVLANLDILIGLLMRNKRSRLVTGGSIAHVGFGLMLMGIFFSSGYEQVLTQNSNPNELAALSADSRNDNVLLQKGLARNIKDFQVTYVGKKEAKGPISKLRVIQEESTSFKVRFEDITGDVFAFVLPKDVFTAADGTINLDVVTSFLNDKLEFLKPSHINERTLYGLKFVPRQRDLVTKQDFLWENDAFTVYPEAEVNPSMGLLAHPSRKIYLDRDVYVHVSTVVKEDEEPKFQFYNFNLTVGDTAQTGRTKLVFDRITSDPIEGTEYELIAKAHIRLVTDIGTVVNATPIYRIDKENRVTIKDHYIDELHTSVAFVGVNTEAGTVNIQVQEQVNPPDDIVVIQAIQKPWINLLWLGTFVLTFGFGMAMWRRIKENRAGRTTKPEEGDEETASEADPMDAESAEKQGDA
ncbi:MAG: cytochrome c biogenesis protein CcsA [Bacteroidetes bacterium]|nr:cytochrome c biogenesis protein CcsA [Bacteroidota bacterium]